MTSTSPPNSGPSVVVLGAGVIGLSVALELHSRGYRPIIVARDLPEDSDSNGFASPWAGCNWFPFDSDGTLPTSQRERITWKGLALLADKCPDLCQKIPFYTVWNSEKKREELWYKDLVGKVPGSHKYATRVESWILHAPNYIEYLSKELRDRGVLFKRKRLSSIDEAYTHSVSAEGPELGKGDEETERVELVVNATGLGAKSLIGVQDDQVYPARGQTVLVRAPWCEKVCVMNTEGFNAVAKPGEAPLPEPAYIIPRPGSEGHFILGGTYIRDNYSTLPDLNTAKRILQDCHKLYPQLSPPGGGWEDIEIISHNVGLRPARDGGARIELERRNVNEGKGVGVGLQKSNVKLGREVGLVHCYGFGSAGFQQSLGAAEQAAALVAEYFARSKP